MKVRKEIERYDSGGRGTGTETSQLRKKRHQKARVLLTVIETQDAKEKTSKEYSGN